MMSIQEITSDIVMEHDWKYGDLLIGNLRLYCHNLLMFLSHIISFHVVKAIERPYP